MKKVISTAIVASIFAAASAAQAVTVYEKDGFTYKIKGDWQIQLRQDPGQDQDLDLEYDDLEIKNAISYDFSDKFSAFGELDFGFKNAADKSNSDEGPHLEEAYLGFSFDMVSILFGKTDSAADEFGVEGAKETIVANDAFDEVGAVDGDDLIKVEADFDIVRVVAAYEIEAESEKSDDNGTFVDFYVGAEFAGVEIGAAYQSYEPKGGETIDIYGVSAAYSVGAFHVAADYSVAEDEETIWNIFTSVKVHKTTKIGAGFVTQDFDEDGKDDVTGYYANVEYKFPQYKNLSVYAEIADSDKDNHDLGYLVGCRFKF